MQKRTGWVGLNREVRVRIFSRIDNPGPGPGRPPRKDIARLLVYTIADHADFIDVPEKNRWRGTWRTTYAEISELTGLDKRQIRSSLIYLEKQQLIKKGDGFRSASENKSQGQTVIKGRGKLVINALFYEELTTVDKEFRAGSLKNNEQAHFYRNKAFEKKNIKKSVTESVEDRTVHVPASLGSDGSLSGESKDALKTDTPAPTVVGSTGNGARTGPLVKREAVPIEKVIAEAAVDLRPTLNQVKMLGIREVYRTHLEKLQRVHRAALKQVGETGTGF